MRFLEAGEFSDLQGATKNNQVGKETLPTIPRVLPELTRVEDVPDTEDSLCALELVNRIHSFLASLNQHVEKMSSGKVELTAQNVESIRALLVVWDTCHTDISALVEQRVRLGMRIRTLEFWRHKKTVEEIVEKLDEMAVLHDSFTKVTMQLISKMLDDAGTAKSGNIRSLYLKDQCLSLSVMLIEMLGRDRATTFAGSYLTYGTVKDSSLPLSNTPHRLVQHNGVVRSHAA